MTQSWRTLTRRGILAICALLGLGIGGAAQASARMYSGSLVIHAFGNDTTTGTNAPFDTSSYIGIPLAGQCNTAPYHAKETLVFPTTPTGTQVFTLTIPAYGGAERVDTDGDGWTDGVPGCWDTTRRAGDPLTGSGLVVTTGAISTSRTPMDPRRFTLPQSVLNKVKSDASFSVYGVYVWEVHFADLHNDAATFRGGGGDGGFAVTHLDTKAKRKAIQTAGKNRFGGVMRLLGSYGDNEGYIFNHLHTSVWYFDWLFDYLGHGGQRTSAGVVAEGYIRSQKNYGYSRDSGGFLGTDTVYAEVFKWTTGTVTVTALGGTFPTILRRKGYDHRTAMGSGAVQLVSPMLTHWVGAGESSTAAIGILKLTFAPEPSGWMMLGAGVWMLAILFDVRRRSRPDTRRSAGGS
jgi:hypothetical protein